MRKYFGTDGFRGEANAGLSADHAFKIGKFLGWYYSFFKSNGERARIVIGKDTRRSSYMFEYSIAAGISSAGGDACLMHVTTTPSVAYITRTDGFDAGVMISASHNPYYDNGIKLLNGHGEKMEDEVIDRIETYLDGAFIFPDGSNEVPLTQKEKIGTIVDYYAGRNRYIGYLISLGLYSFRGLKVGLDCANGASWAIAKSVFEALGATVYVINDHPDGLNINMGAGSTHPEGLQKLVLEKKLDVGFAYDGDADRCICVDEKGALVNGDRILYIYAKYMKERGKLLTNTVVTTIMSNLGLYKAFDKLGIEYAKTSVGDKNVYDYMVQHGCRIGGEESGHIIFLKYATTGDGILTSLKLMEVLCARKVPFSHLSEEMKDYPHSLVNLRVLDKSTALDNEAVGNTIKQIESELGGDGRLLVRASGTEPVVRVMVEAESDDKCRMYSERVVVAFRDNGLLA